MQMVRKSAFGLLLLAAGFLSSIATSPAQEPVILSAQELEKVVPANFYFEGQLGPTQMRNSAAVRFGDKQHIVAALVDTSGYASNIRNKYEGFIISDIRFFVRHLAAGGGMGASASAELPAGAYGFGFTDDLKVNIFDVGGKKLQTVSATKDDKLQSPRPLSIIKNGSELRLYKGRTFVVLAVK